MASINSRDLFLGVLGHDMRNPLGATMILSRMVRRDDAVFAITAKAAIRHYSSGSKLKNLLDDLLNFTKKHDLVKLA